MLLLGFNFNQVPPMQLHTFSVPSAKIRQSECTSATQVTKSVPSFCCEGQKTNQSRSPASLNWFRAFHSLGEKHCAQKIQ